MLLVVKEFCGEHDEERRRTQLISLGMRLERFPYKRSRTIAKIGIFQENNATPYD